MKIASPCISANSRAPISPAVSLVSAAQTTKTSAARSISSSRAALIGLPRHDRTISIEANPGPCNIKDFASRLAMTGMG
jgi:hypothetical protein